jgi:hypothetical protein
MLFTKLLSGLLVVGAALAQTTPPGFTPAVNMTLDVSYGTQYITPGLMVKKSSKSFGVRCVEVENDMLRKVCRSSQR